MIRPAEGILQEKGLPDGLDRGPEEEDEDDYHLGQDQEIGQTLDPEFVLLRHIAS